MDSSSHNNFHTIQAIVEAEYSLADCSTAHECSSEWFEMRNDEIFKCFLFFCLSCLKSWFIQREREREREEMRVNEREERKNVNGRETQFSFHLLPLIKNDDSLLKHLEWNKFTLYYRFLSFSWHHNSTVVSWRERERYKKRKKQRMRRRERERKKEW